MKLTLGKSNAHILSSILPFLEWGVAPFIVVGAGRGKRGSAQSISGLTGVEVPVGPLAPVGPAERAVGPPVELRRIPAKDVGAGWTAEDGGRTANGVCRRSDRSVRRSDRSGSEQLLCLPVVIPLAFFSREAG